MIHHLENIDNINARELALKLSQIPTVVTVRWYPPYKSDHISAVGDDGLMFWVLLEANHGKEYPQYWQCVSRSAWDNPESHQDVVNLMKSNAERFNATGQFFEGTS